MFAQLDPSEIVRGHLLTLGAAPGETFDRIKTRECLLFLGSGLPFAVFQAYVIAGGGSLAGETVGVIVSSASMIAGLLLNLLVLVYTLVAAHEAKLTDARELFRITAKHAFYNISFTVLASLVLVVVCLLALASNQSIRNTGNVLTFYIGPLVAISLLMVLRKCHALISFHFSAR